MLSHKAIVGHVNKLLCKVICIKGHLRGSSAVLLMDFSGQDPSNRRHECQTNVNCSKGPELEKHSSNRVAGIKKAMVVKNPSLRSILKLIVLDPVSIYICESTMGFDELGFTQW